MASVKEWFQTMGTVEDLLADTRRLITALDVGKTTVAGMDPGDDRAQGDMSKEKAQELMAAADSNAKEASALLAGLIGKGLPEPQVLAADVVVEPVLVEGGK